MPGIVKSCFGLKLFSFFHTLCLGVFTQDARELLAVCASPVVLLYLSILGLQVGPSGCIFATPILCVFTGDALLSGQYSLFTSLKSCSTTQTLCCFFIRMKFFRAWSSFTPSTCSPPPFLPPRGSVMVLGCTTLLEVLASVQSLAMPFHVTGALTIIAQADSCSLP